MQRFISLQTNINMTLLGDSVETIAQSDINTQAQNQITHQVGDTTITATSDCVIIKAGGVEVVIDSKGLVVKGGEIKAE